METTESRFAHLLRPIRELTKNWEVDVASELNDYLEELDEMCITFDEGRTRLNFAEAALLIQGSTCIYSKKVELLHSLVYQTLEYINERNKKQSKEMAAEDRERGRAQNIHDDDDMDEFTHLDLEASENSQRSGFNTTVNVVPLPPESLIPPETHEKHKLPLNSVKGEMICSQKDFRINLFIPGQESLILLRSSAATGFLLNQHPLDSVVQNQAEDGAADGGDAEAVENFLPLDDHMELDQIPEEHIEQQMLALSEGRGIRERRQVESGNQKQQDEALPEEDVWALHDPYAILAEEKPLKPGKCYRVPEGLDDGGKRKRRRAKALQDFRSWFRETFNPLVQKLKNGPTFTDLNYIYLSTLKNKVKTQRRVFRKTGVVMSEEELIRTFLQPVEVGLQQQEAVLLGGGDDDSDIDDDIPEFEGDPDFISPGKTGGQTDDLTYEDLVKRRVEQLLVNSQGYTQETALSRRVKDWEDQIGPELVLQEKRPPFDIHDYGERIVGELSSIGHCRSFASIVHDLDNFEACKLLLASLQLANDHTVEIHSAAGLEDSLDSMSLTLLSTQKATDRFKKLTTSTVTQHGPNK